jgi:hypothetical protein
VFGRPGRALFVALLAAVLQAGCLEMPTTPDGPDTPLQLRGVSIGGTFGSSCPPTSGATAPWSCEEGSLEFTRFDCDPPQDILIQMGLSEPAGFATSGDASMIRCDLTVTWSAMGRSLLPETTVEASVRLNDRMEVHTCVTGADGSCSLEGTIGSRFGLYGADETVELAAALVILVKPSMGPGNQFEGSALIQKTFRLRT